MLPESIGEAIDLLGQIRPVVMELEEEESARKKLFERLFFHCMECLDKGYEITAKELTKLVNTGTEAEK